MEKELNRDEAQPEARASGSPQPPDPLELAHVLFMDLVAFSAWPMEEQRRGLRELQEIVRNAPQVRDGERNDRLIRRPTGDGMALIFFGDPMACVECAWHVASELKKTPLKLRMGINSGPIYRVADINGDPNVAGGGINMAQRMMDAGDDGHILVSKSTADILLQFRDWAPYLHDLGEHSVKHQVKVQIYNLYTSELGNPAIPSRLQAENTLSAKLQRRRVMAAAMAALLILGVGLAAASRMLVSNRRRSVAVMGFRNITSRPDAAWVSTGLSEGLRAQLASTGKLRTISGEESTEMWKDLGLTELSSMGKETLNRFHNRGVDLVIVGSYTDLPDGRIHLNVEIQDTGSGETAGLVADGTDTEITKLIAQTGEQLRSTMGLGTISAEKERQLALAEPSKEARPFYDDGLQKLRAYEPVQARSALDRAISIDPEYPFAHAALAEAWAIRGYDGLAMEEAAKAFERSNGLLLEDKLRIKARYFAIATKWQESIEAYRQLYQNAPDDLDYGLALAGVQRSAGQGRDALATLAKLRKLPKPEGADPRIDLEEAETAASLGDLKRGLAAAASAAGAAQATGARFLESRSLSWSCFALRNLGSFDKGKQDCERARKIATDLQDKLGTARAVNNLANILSDQGDLDGAKRLFQQALALGQEIGDQRDVSGALNNLGIILASQGDLSQANQRYDDALTIEREIGFKAEIPKTLVNQGALLHQQGDLPGSQRAFEQAIKAAQESGSQDSLAVGIMNLGVVLFERGELAEAEKRYQEAIAIQRTLGAKSSMATTLDSLADLLVVRAELSEAESRYREAVSIQEGLGEKGSIATSKIGLATVLVERDQGPGAETEARAAVEEFHAENDIQDEKLARLLLARALIVQNKTDQAHQELSTAELAGRGKSSDDGEDDVVIAFARARAALGGQAAVQASLRSLREVVRKTKKSGRRGFELEARLAIGEIELAHGDRDLARVELRALQKEASANGYILIARKAAIGDSAVSQNRFP
jgi:tetratricopeptide (TPR) repeat protein/class 3 adenylate cyclase/TolB-like protein